MNNIKFKDKVKIIGKGTPYITIPKKLGIKKNDIVEVSLKIIKKEVDIKK